MSLANKEDIVSSCANCGKGEESVKLKSCTACKLVKYCSRDCQIAHRPQHKKECRKRAAELHDIELFKQPPPAEDCPICFQRLPTLNTGRVYMVCCGKEICSGCICAPVYDHEGNVIAEKTCPLCRTPPPSSERWMKRYEKRMELNDAQAIHNVGVCYSEGRCGLPQDRAKALELWHRAAELQYAASYHSIGNAYNEGRGVEVDGKKANHYWELAAIVGNVPARHNLGCLEVRAGNWNRALKHWMISVKDGDPDSLECIKRMYEKELAPKDVYAEALQHYQVYLDEIKSDQRDKAAALYDSKYY